MIFEAKELIQYTKENHLTLAQIVLQDEMKRSGKTEEAIRKELLTMVEVMEDSAKEYLKREGKTRFGMIDGFAKKMNTYAKEKNTLCGQDLLEAMAMGFSTLELSSSMGKIVAGPTAGSSGIMPGALVMAKKKFHLSNETLVDAILVAGGIGQIIGRYANFAGAEGGCQAECGSASAMAAAALVYLMGGDIEQQLHAASFAIIHILGLVCDPIAGLVEYPCTFRNSSGVVNAMISADMAMAGITSIIPFDEVALAMGDIGKTLPASLRETGLGGLAGTCTGLTIRHRFLEK